MSVPFSPSDAESINATTTTLPSVPNALDIRIGGAEGKPDDTTMNIEEAVVAVPEIIMDSPQQEVQVQQQQALEDVHSIEDHPSVIEEEDEEHTVATDSLVVGDDNIASVPTRTTDINQFTTTTVPLFVLDLQVRDNDLYIYLFITIHILYQSLLSFFSTLSLPLSGYYPY